MHKEISMQVDLFLPLFLWGYQKRLSTQQAQISLLEKWEIVLDWKGYAVVILMDLCKVFDILNHDLLIAKLYAYGFLEHSVKVTKSYLDKLLAKTKGQYQF